MSNFAKKLGKVFLYIFITTAVAGFLVGGVAGVFMFAVRMAPLAIIAGGIVYGIWWICKKAEIAEEEEKRNQSLNLARAMRDAKNASSVNNAEHSPIIP